MANLIELYQFMAIKSIRTGEVFRYQQFQLEPLIFEGHQYDYLKFDWANTENSLDIDGSGIGTIKINYSQLLNVSIEQQNGFRGSPLVHTIMKGWNGPIMREYYTVQSKSIDDEENSISLQLEFAINGINGRIPGALLERKIFGALPNRNQVRL